MNFRDLSRFVGALFFVILTVGVATAQSPNTGSMIITVVDPNGALVAGAKISVINESTGNAREATSNSDGVATFPGLSLTGMYRVNVTAVGFTQKTVSNLTLRAGETANLKFTLPVGQMQDSALSVTVTGTTEGVRTDPLIGISLTPNQIDETPILGRKTSSLPLLNSAFRPAEGTGDLVVTQTYVVTGVGGRRETTVLLDGARNDEGWGRQTSIATVPIGAIQEMTVLTNSFSAEFGWTAGPALNIVTKSGTNNFRGEVLGLFRPGGWQARSFSTKNFCPKSVPSCVVPNTLKAISPVDVPDALQQYSGSIGGPIIRDKTFFFATLDHTRQDRTTFLSPTLPAFVLPADGHLDVTGHYRQTLFDGRVDHSIDDRNRLAFRFNLDRFFDDNPQDAVGGTNAPSVARRYSRASWSTQANYTTVLSTNLLNEARFAYLNGDPVTRWEAQTLSTTYTRGGTVPFTVGQSRLSDLFGRQWQIADTLSLTVGTHYLRLGGSVIRHTSGGTGNEPGTAVLGTFTFRNTTTAPLDQLTLADVQNYTQPINFGIDSYKLSQWLLSGFVQDDWKVRPDLTLSLGLRYDRQTLTQANTNFAPRIGFGWNPNGDARTAVRGGYAMYYTQIRANVVAGYLVNGLDGLTTYTATPGQLGFPTCLTCVPANVDPRTLPASAIPPRDIMIRAGQRSFYEAQFARYGLNFDLLPNYPDKLENPRSQVFTLGVEREIVKGWFAGADYVHQHMTGIDRTLDLNAPSAFDRTAPGQTRTVAAANATRPILPVASGVRQVNVVMNLGNADYDGLQTQISYRGHSRVFASLSYTLSKATNTTELDGNGINPNQSIISRLGEEERGPSVLDQRHRAVFTFSYRFPYGFTAGTVTALASARPFSATTGVDNNGDGLNNDRPVTNGAVISKSAFRGSGTQDVSIFVENRIKLTESMAILLRLEGFNRLNHANMLGRGQTIYGDAATSSPNFGQFVSGVGSAATAIPAFANIDPPRMFQLQARFIF
jgi:hypothetical protein